MIDDPKTPFHEEVSDDDMEVDGGGVAGQEIEIDPVTKTNLNQAQQNKIINAATSSGVVRKAPTVYAPASVGLDPADLTRRLLAAEEQKTASVEDEALSEAASKWLHILLTHLVFDCRKSRV